MYNILKYNEDMIISANKTVIFTGKSFLEQKHLNNIRKEGQKFDLSYQITSATGSQCGMFLLANISMHNPRIKLYNVSNLKLCIQRYEGHKQSNYKLILQFSDCYENLVLCRSEDNSKKKKELKPLEDAANQARIQIRQ